MHSLTKMVFSFSLFFNSSNCIGQKYTNGSYIAHDTTYYTNPEEIRTETLKIIIKEDSLVWYQNTTIKTGDIVKSTYRISRGVIKKFNKSYVSNVILTECDTCPKYWKEPFIQEPAFVLFDSIWQKQYVIENRKLSKEDAERVGMIFFKVLPTGDILEFGLIYKKENVLDGVRCLKRSVP